MRKTGIFGGSFNPIHNGHVALARHILQQTALDEVWLMVSPHNPLKAEATLLDDSDRLRLAQAALASETGISASDFEFTLPRPSYTWHTLQALRRRWPDREFALIIGADNWALFDRWRDHDRIISSHSIIIYPRRGYDIDRGTLPPGATLVDTPLYDVSSTEVRRRIAEGAAIRHLVPQAVADIIEKERIYKNGK